MEQLILIAHVLAALGIIGLVLLQQGKGASMGASFGAGGSQTLFGSQGGSGALVRGTVILAVLFFATSFGLAIFAKSKAQQLGLIDLPVPAVIESQENTEEFSDIPVLERSSNGEVPVIEDQPVINGTSDGGIPDHGR